MRKNALSAYIQLARPANIITAIADIWAGLAIAGVATSLLSGFDSFFSAEALPMAGWLTLSTIGLYGGGVAFNDVFDAELDAVERPERPIPSGAISKTKAATLALGLLIMGILAAWQVNYISGLLSIAIALLAVLYDYWGKHQNILGPVNMGLCRAVNLLLGISFLPVILKQFWWIGTLPLIYVAAITMISRGEVHGKNKKALIGGFFMYLLVLIIILLLAFTNGETGWESVPFVLLFGVMLFPPLIKAMRSQQPQMIGKAVKAGVISLILLNASLASAFAGWQFGILVSLLLPISIWIGKKFAVT